MNNQISDKSNRLKRQYGFFVTICIVVGFVVGTGIFWQPGRVLYQAGSLGQGVLAWLIGGITIASCVYMFSICAARYEKVHGMVDYAEEILGRRYGYICGWFFFVMYQTAGYAIIAYISASFTAALAGHDNTTNSAFVFFMTAFYMVAVFVLNFITPRLAMKLNVSTVIIRLIPLIAMATIGLIIGIYALGSATPYAHIYSVANGTVAADIGQGSFFGAVFATAFAYNGWQAAVAFNSEVVRSKKTFPLALLLGFLIVVIIYVLYFIGIVLNSDPTLLIADNQLGTRAAFAAVFGARAQYVVMVFVIISGLGILNMCCMGMSRGLYALARRGMGPAPLRMVQLDAHTGAPINSMILCFGLSFLWLMVIYGNQHGWFFVNGQAFSFVLPDFYNMLFFALLIPMFAGFVVKNYNNQSIHISNRIFAPILAIFGAGLMISTLVLASPTHAVVYTLVFIILSLLGTFFYKRRA